VGIFGKRVLVVEVETIAEGVEMGEADDGEQQEQPRQVSARHSRSISPLRTHLASKATLSTDC
jgi:hypothetical protein